MAIDINTIAPTDAAPAPANSEPAPEKSGLPTEVLEQPVFSALLQGSPAALWVETGSKDPTAVLAVKNGKKLNDVGLFFDRSKDEGIDILFNAQFLSPQLVEAAKKKGKLKELASSLSEVNAAINGTGPAPEAGGGALPAAGMPSPTPVDSPLNTQRVDNLTAGGPTSGNFPGAGRVLNGITKNVV